MALSQDDRITISKKLVDIPKEDAVSADNKSKLQDAKSKAQKQDNANKNLQDIKTLLINLYQKELKKIDGLDKTEILEQDMIDSAQQIIGNSFSPNQPNVPIPSLPSGVWKNFIPFSRSKAVGKNYNETNTVIQKEQDIIGAVQTLVTTMESYSSIGRSSGQSCNTTGTCSLPAYTTQSTCTGNSGIWTPGPDLISNDVVIQTTATNLITQVNNWKAFLQATVLVITTSDTEPTRQSQNSTSLADANNAIAQIDAWLTYSTFDTTHGQTTCSGFNSYNVNLLNPTKFRVGELSVLKNEATARLAYIPTRVTQINTYLGSVVQDMSTGSVTSSSGFYGDRMGILNLRLNLMNGSLRKLEGLKLGEKAQDEAVNSNANAASVYGSVMRVSAFKAPATGISTIHVKDATGFSISDSVYVISDTQLEISATIIAVVGNAITLSVNIPQKYRQNENARIYKEV
jgi:hypothetical protein